MRRFATDLRSFPAFHAIQSLKWTEDEDKALFTRLLDPEGFQFFRKNQGQLYRAVSPTFTSVSFEFNCILISYSLIVQAADEDLVGRSAESCRARYVRAVRIYHKIKARDRHTGGGDGDEQGGNSEAAEKEEISTDDIEDFEKWKFDMFDEV